MRTVPTGLGACKGAGAITGSQVAGGPGAGEQAAEERPPGDEVGDEVGEGDGDHGGPPMGSEQDIGSKTMTPSFIARARSSSVSNRISME